MKTFGTGIFVSQNSSECKGQCGKEVGLQISDVGGRNRRKFSEATMDDLKNAAQKSFKQPTG
jgi:hypothetical protein